MVLNEINWQLEHLWIIVKRGAMVDAGITDSPRSPCGHKEYEIVEDRDEETGKSESEKVMLKELLKPNVNGEARRASSRNSRDHYCQWERYQESRNTPKKVNLPEMTLVYTDKGYDSAENTEALAQMQLKSRIMHKGTRPHKIAGRNAGDNYV